MKIKFNALGHQIKVNPVDNKDIMDELTAKSNGEYTSPVNKDFICKLNETLKQYTDGKKNLEAKIIENERWYRSQHWDIIRGKDKDEADPEPVSSYLFNTIANKHGDAMDNYPEPNFIEREESDIQEAQTLSKVVPLVIQKNLFRKTYSNAWWYKLKQGCSVYGAFWNSSLENGLGDIDIQKIDLLRCYWKPGIEDVQKSPKFFILALVDNDILIQQYPQLDGQLTGKTLDVKTYFNDDNYDTTNQSIVVDCYYKKINEDGKEVLHLTKYVENIPLESTEDDPETAKVGQYDHGMYPVIFDPLFPEDGTPVGFGFVDICKNPQMYIDKLDQLISKNALVSGKQRWIYKDNGNIDPKDLMDMSKDAIACTGEIEGNVKEFQAKPLDGFIVNHRQNKISEMKEVSGNNDFNRGESGAGITAASAIMALQEAGNKLSRDMIGDSYGVYTQLMYMCIELIRQFYDEDRKFRITNEKGKADYISYNNKGLKDQQLPPEYEGQGIIDHPDQPGVKYPSVIDAMDTNMGKIPDTNYTPKFRKPIFDIDIKPEKTSPFSRVAHNELAKEMYGLGFFDPQKAPQSLIALEMMQFEGKEKIVQMVSKNGDLAMQIQQLQLQMQQIQQQSLSQVKTMSNTMQMMNGELKKVTGNDFLGNMEQMKQYMSSTGTEPDQQQSQGGGNVQNG